MSLITVKAATEKLPQLTGGVSSEAVSILQNILDGKRELNKEDTHYDPDSLSYIGWVEERLASKHLGYLPKHQSNGIWGGSTDTAFKRLCEVYEVPWTGKINQNVMRALIDGTRAADHLSGPPNSYQWLKALVKKTRGNWDEREGAINLVGIRGYTLEDGKIANAPDIYNDIIFVCFVRNGVEKAIPFLASVDPGFYYYHVRPLNWKGCASLITGEPYTYELGEHRPSSGPYPALNPINQGWVKVHRVDKSGVPGPNAPIEWGQWCNIHAGTPGPQVYAASAGCTVIQGDGPWGINWQRFWNLVKVATNPKAIPFIILDNI